MFSFFLSFLMQNSQFLLLFYLKYLLNWSKIRRGFLLQNKKNAKKGNFVTGTEIFTQNNLIISIVLIWYLSDDTFAIIPSHFDVLKIIVAKMNDASSVTWYYMVLMLHIWLHRIILEDLRFYKLIIFSPTGRVSVKKNYHFQKWFPKKSLDMALLI